MDYVSDIIGDEYYRWSPGNIKIISTPTGSRKTTFVLEKLLENAAKHNKYLVYICNRRTLDNQIKERAENSSVGHIQLSNEAKQHLLVFTYQFCESTKQFPEFSISPDTSKASKQDMFYYKMYNYIHPIGIRKEEILYYVFDECHYICSDSLVNTNTNYWTPEKFRQKHAITVLLTATPEMLLCYLNLPYFDLSRFFENAKIQYDINKARRDKLSQPYNAKEVNTIFTSLGFVNYIPNNEVLKYYSTTEKKVQLRKLQNPFNYGFEWIDSIIEAQSYVESNYFKYGDSIYHSPAKYDYMSVWYIDNYSDLYDEIINSREKWMIFVDSEQDGLALEMFFQYNKVDAVFLSAKRRTNRHSAAKKVFSQIAMSGSFDCQVLISTSVLDNGVSIDVSDTMNMVISQSEKTEFIQMIGRCRMIGNATLNLYIRNYTAGEINSLRAKMENSLRYMINFYFRNSNKIAASAKRSTVEGAIKSGSAGLIYMNDFFNNNTITIDIMPGHTISKTAMVYCLYCLKNLYEASLDNGIYGFYLYRQLSWIGKEYDDARWYNYHRCLSKINTLLERTASEGSLDNDGKKRFCQECLDCFKDFPKRFLTPSLRVFIKKHSSIDDPDCRLPGKARINSLLEYCNLGYVIEDKQSGKKGRPNLWYVKKIETEQE